MLFYKGRRPNLYITIFLITSLVVLFIRTFFIQSYTVSSSQMETALIHGDLVLVDKSAYGIRLPITILTIPFTFDSIFGLRSYSNFIQLKYKRLFKKSLKRYDVVLLNNPEEVLKPIDKRSLILSRCVAIPGDTIHFSGNDIYTNRKKYSPSSDMMISYCFLKNKKDSVKIVMDRFRIPYCHLYADSIYNHISLNKYQTLILNQKLPISIQISEDFSHRMDHTLVVPAKGVKIPLTSFNIVFYSRIIQEECENKYFRIENSKIFIDNIPISSYEFTENYYLFISDNPDYSLDSRSFGFVSEKEIIGKVSYIWYSSTHEQIIWDRCFSPVR